jgi:DNA (cytosine-5)-methyltransferase 1
MTITVGSICSGIEAASVAWSGLDYSFKWFSEIDPFACNVLSFKYPKTKNLGNMRSAPALIKENKIEAPDLICGGTPCQAFSLAGLKEGLNDARGNLTPSFVDIINQNDMIRTAKGLAPTMVLWENVEGVLNDKTNAFGSFLSYLAGLQEVIPVSKWACSGVLKGPKRNIAWRVLDAKYFGLPQQRKRLYVLAGGKEFKPEDIIFEDSCTPMEDYPTQTDLFFEKEGYQFECFRAYTDCLYAAYGTKWNGNAAAYNGSLFVLQNKRLRRLSPLECERLMGFPDNYTKIPKSSQTKRYKAVGNSWSIPVIKWLGERILFPSKRASISPKSLSLSASMVDEYEIMLIGNKFIPLEEGKLLNCTLVKSNPIYGKLSDFISSQDISEKLYISPVGCHGILRRANERKININTRLKESLTLISEQMDEDTIEKISLRQKRGQFSTSQPCKSN